MDMTSGTRDTRGHELPTLLVWSVWAVAYCVVCGVPIVSKVPGHYGRMGWELDNTDGRTKRLLDEWRSGTPMVNGRALIDAHSRLMDDVKHLA